MRVNISENKPVVGPLPSSCWHKLEVISTTVFKTNNQSCCATLFESCTILNQEIEIKLSYEI